MHDGVAAMIAAAKMSLQSIPHLEDEEKKNQQLDKLSALLGNTHHEVRRIAHDLLPVVLEKEGLVAALHHFAAALNQMGMIQIIIETHLQADFRLPKRTDLMLYRIIQELINNILKHAQATNVQITFANTNDHFTITVVDNGIGYLQESEGQGLYSIRQRLQALGGRFDIHGGENIGTKVVLQIW
ncbi:MAG: hypothetical protein KL787_08615 [Taibaiella sp.]|nr:hypothetical protein [Taibaiella sp.]